MDFRTVFDAVPERFDRWRTRYCDAMFEDVIAYAHVGADSDVLEIGPGTGQATEPILRTGCSYLAIELGENFEGVMRDKFGRYDNFDIVRGDFETHDFGDRTFDLVYSAATIQWIPEDVGFPKAHDLLKAGGAFAMMMTRTDYRSANEALYADIQRVYEAHFHPETPYTCHLAYENVVKYGFEPLERRAYAETRVYDADEYVAYISIHADHLTLQEPHKSRFFAGIRDAIMAHGNRIELRDTIILYLTRRR